LGPDYRDHVHVAPDSVRSQGGILTSRRQFGLPFWLAAALLAALLAAIPPARAQEAGEYQIKAAFLVTIAKFVDWAPGKLDDGAPIVVGIYGKDPFGPTLDKTLEGKTVNGRAISIRRVAGLEEARVCTIVFVAAVDRKRLAQTLAALSAAGVMSVGESPNFAQQGGVVNFVLRGNAVALEINPIAAERAHLRISSRLLGLARIVKDTLGGVE